MRLGVFAVFLGLLAFPLIFAGEAYAVYQEERAEENRRDTRAERRLRAQRQTRVRRILRREARVSVGDDPSIAFTMDRSTDGLVFRPLIAENAISNSAVLPDLGITAEAPTFDLDRFEENLIAAVENESIGYSYAITQAGRLVRSSASGDARTTTDGQADMTVEKEIVTASISKTITAVAMLRAMAEEGIALDDPIADYLPADWTLGPNMQQVTFRRLFTHRSGLDMIGGGLDNLPDGDAVTAGRQRFSCCTKAGNDHQAMAQVVANGVDPLDDTPTDDVHVYTNANYSLMRAMLPQVIGAEELVESLMQQFSVGDVYAAIYTDYVQQNVLAPAGITRLNCTPYESENSRTLIYNLQQPNDSGFDGGSWFEACGANGWYMSSVDLARFLVYLRYTDDILDSKTRELMNDNFLGWHDPTVFAAHVDGRFGTYRGHGGTYGMQNCMINFHINVEAVVAVNSSGGSFTVHLCRELKTAFDEAWQ